jgi:hypothetical protein
MSAMYDYAEDLEPYNVAGRLKLDDAIAIGWLGAAHNFANGLPSPQFLQKLLRIMEARSPYCVHSHILRGIVPCKLCGETSFPAVDPNRKRLVGSSTIWITRLAGGYYVSPSLIAHYISVHRYRPPNEFIDSVLEFDEAAPFEAEKAYKELVTRASEGVVRFW